MADPARKQSEQPVDDGDAAGPQNGSPAPRKTSMPEMSGGPTKPSFLLRRRSSGSRGTMEPLRSDDPEVMQHLKHLGPSNAANRPKSTRINTVKIKPGQAAATPDIPTTIPENSQAPAEGIVVDGSHAPEGGIGEGLLSSAGLEASDGVHSVAVGYGTMAPSGDRMSWRSGYSGRRPAEDEPTSPKGGSKENEENTHLLVDNRDRDEGSRERSRSVSTIGSLRSVKSRSRSPPKKRHTARSGSISENVVDVNGIKKLVLETTSSSDSEDKILVDLAEVAEDQKHSEAESANTDNKGGSKKKRKKRGKKKKGGPSDSSESQPLLG